MRPVVTPAEMAAIDAEAPEPVEELIARAGWATAQAALDLLGSPYGKRVAVLAGKGNNGADGRSAVRHLERAGARCTVHDVGGAGRAGDPGGGGWPGAGRGRAEPIDLVIDACYGTGLRGDFDPSALGLPAGIADAPVLAVDIPSGVDGLTGALRGRPLAAAATVTFAAAKPGLLLPPGRWLTGPVTVADIGLDCSRARIHHLGTEDLARWPRRGPDDHKWRRAVGVIGGGPGMSGAPRLAAEAALRAGAGYAVLCLPGAALDQASAPSAPIEAVATPTPATWGNRRAWDPESARRLERLAAAVVGPGLTDSEANRNGVIRWLGDAPVPTVFDAGALDHLASLRSLGWPGRSEPGQPGRPEGPGAVLTPHDGEFTRLAGHPVGDDRIASARELAARTGVVVLLKGPTTVAADPGGEVLVTTAGDARLATAGTGDVLAGLIAAGLAGGLDPLEAAGLGAELHGRAAGRGHPVGLTASDLPALVAALLSDLGR